MYTNSMLNKYLINHPKTPSEEKKWQSVNIVDAKLRIHILDIIRINLRLRGTWWLIPNKVKRSQRSCMDSRRHYQTRIDIHTLPWTSFFSLNSTAFRLTSSKTSPAFRRACSAIRPTWPSKPLPEASHLVTRRTLTPTNRFLGVLTLHTLREMYVDVGPLPAAPPHPDFTNSPLCCAVTTLACATAATTVVMALCHKITNHKTTPSAAEASTSARKPNPPQPCSHRPTLPHSPPTNVDLPCLSPKISNHHSSLTQLNSTSSHNRMHTSASVASTSVDSTQEKLWPRHSLTSEWSPLHPRATLNCTPRTNPYRLTWKVQTSSECARRDSRDDEKSIAKWKWELNANECPPLEIQPARMIVLCARVREFL